MRWLVVALVVVVAVAVARPASACSCGRFDEVTAESCQGSKRVFAGVVTAYAWPNALDWLVLDRSYDAVGVELAVDRVWKGEVPDRVFTTTGMGGGDCGIHPEVGTRFVVCDDEAGGAAPDFKLCSRPAFQAPELEVALGPAHEPGVASSWRACVLAALLTIVVAALLQRRPRTSQDRS
ncbi:MAG: hypothetical protein IPQ07_33225 [Myxococcales bacterium]|nr:hypothetical protein [Myxococcales bacterium]